jgi:hypothetical protein
VLENDEDWLERSCEKLLVHGGKVHPTYNNNNNNNNNNANRIGHFLRRTCLLKHATRGEGGKISGT